ncbi:hypothetical protein [Marinicella litoralis]|uniref:Uncharacterized protein n=1 Tax=Marinicella litoralis TaxID=644220 RepID=A0A4R6XL86_9GAMM|nr:hypothetical protein [Marinicella litoralis]TDR20365.1 hypothetical protein C8D91_1337 [Marinicella litoralis]
MKIISLILATLSATSWAIAMDFNNEEMLQSMQQINQFQMVSDQLASAATPELHQYQHLKDAGFKHIIVLSTGLHLVEKIHAEALGMTFVQVSVSLTKPTNDLFYVFSDLLEAYGDDPVFVYSEQNWRAATFVHRYQGLISAGLLAAK